MNTSTLTQNQLLGHQILCPCHIRSPDRSSSPQCLTWSEPQSSLSPSSQLLPGFGKTTSSRPGSRAASAGSPSTRKTTILSSSGRVCFPAFDRQLPDHFAQVFLDCQSPPCPPLKQLLGSHQPTGGEHAHFVLILDDYQVITQEQVHATLSYLVQHLPPQLRSIIATPADPPARRCSRSSTTTSWKCVPISCAERRPRLFP